MNHLSLGGRVRVTTARSPLNCRVGRIVHVTQPFVANDRMRSDALEQMPLYKVRLDDGSQERCCGRELESLEVAAEPI
jgi:hypothetical protein